MVNTPGVYAFILTIGVEAGLKKGDLSTQLMYPQLLNMAIRGMKTQQRQRIVQ